MKTVKKIGGLKNLYLFEVLVVLDGKAREYLSLYLVIQV